MSTTKKLQEPILFNHTPESILQVAKEAIQRTRTDIKKICQNAKVNDASFSTIMVPLIALEGEMSLVQNPLIFHKDVSPDENIRNAAADAAKLFADYERELYSNEDLFKLVDAVFKTTKNNTLDKESEIVLADTHRKFIENGMSLATERESYLKLRKQISDLEIDFQKNCAEDMSGIWLTKEEMQGVPNDLVDELEKGTGENEDKFWLTMKPHHYFRAIESVEDGEVRRKILFCHETTCPKNLDIFTQVILMRDKAARMLGYPNHAAFRLERKMAKSIENVNHFLSDIHSRLQEGGKNEIKSLKELKKAHVEKQGKEFIDKFYSWDYRFYKELMKKEYYSVDQLKLSEYFELQTTVTKMFDIFKKSFGVVFETVDAEKRNKISPTGNGKDLIWHEDVQLVKLWDNEDAGGDFLGYLYLDMFPREGKHSHPMMAPLGDGYIKADGSRYYPSAALVTCFPKPSAQKPSLLTHDEAEALFHELGHCLHSLVSRTKYCVTHGVNTKYDFVEAPSQMLEHWVWEPSQLKYFCHHYSYLSPEYQQSWEKNNPDRELPSKEIPDDMIDNLIKSKNVNIALFYLRQLMFGMFDMKVHDVKSPEDVMKMDYTALFNTLERDIFLLDSPEDENDGLHWAHGHTTFAHLLDGYDAGYYGYMYSKTFAVDMFYSAFKENPASIETGKRYRYTVLEKGGSQDPMEILENFLGRKPQLEAFYQDIGLTQ